MENDDQVFKIILCGRKGVGKTSLLRLISEPVDYDDNSSDPLKSIKKTQDKITIQLNYQGRPIKAELWDTGSFEAHGGSLTIPTLYFRRAHAAMLVYLSGDEESKLELKDWIRTILNHSPNCVLSLWCNNRNCEFGSSITTRDIISVYAEDYNISPHNCISFTDGDTREVHSSLERLIQGLQAVDVEESIRLGDNEGSTGTAGKTFGKSIGCTSSLTSC